MKTLIETTLNIPVYAPHETISFPGATIDERKEAPDNYGDGKQSIEVTDVYIDLWYKSAEARNNAARSLRTALLNNFSTTGISINYSFDTNARAYRAELTFQKWR